jgi:hypothetical protein
MKYQILGSLDDESALNALSSGQAKVQRGQWLRFKSSSVTGRFLGVVNGVVSVVYGDACTRGWQQTVKAFREGMVLR